MGVASYREDIYLRFLESTALLAEAVILAPPAAICPLCGSQLESQSALLGHLSEAHRGERPILLLHGREPDRHCVIGYHLQKDRILVQNCTSARLRINGHGPVDVSSSRVASLLTDELDCIVELELENKFDRSAEPVRQLYHLSIRVPSKHALDDVDRAFVHHLGTDAPHMTQVAAFLNDPRCAGIVSEYADSLAAYVRGVLIKDQDRNTGVTLRAAEARDLYGHALGRLGSFRRLLPNVICGLIRFALNDFNLSEHPTGVPRVDRMMNLLAPLAGKKGPAVQKMSKPEVVRTIALCPIDHGADRVLRIGESMAKQRRWGPVLQEECRAAASASMLEAADREKILAVWAATALRLRAADDALEPLRQLRATFPFGDWAQHRLEEIDEVSL
jgi:hypothetical protein